MTRAIRRFGLQMLCALALVVVLPVSAQSEGTLVVGQPTVGNLADPAAVITFDYPLAQDSAVVIEAFGEAPAPAVTILRDGAVVAAEPNTAGSLTIALTAVLNAGTYTVQVSSANATAGLVILIVNSETPITAQPLALGTPISGAVNAESPLAIYSISGLTAPADLYVTQTGGGGVRVLNAETSAISALIGGEFTEARLQIPANGSSYRVEVLYADAAHTYTLCLSAVGAPTCSGESLPPAPVATPVTDSVCMLTPLNAGGVNIRQSASVNAPVIGALPGGTSVAARGISPDGSFFSVTFNGVNGWVAASAVGATGSCGALTVVEPPPISLPPTPLPPPTPSGPCLIRMTGEQLVYSQPVVDPSYIFDEVQPGFELIPVGRLADNSWWQTNYAMAWISTSAFGSTATVSGDCRALPIVSP
ncbi:MAG: SH3 domain-containing protein [Chloroflexi bacterium]|uniref:SH3 domain-containing protein n=1 Tax=Candidatus Flexifilum breve TaxID=3140694 RepID=UPI003136ABC0|nr:SH3 domain-containing protein [Chloroflexota bacterium]